MKAAAGARAFNIVCFATFSAALEHKFHLGHRIEDSEPSRLQAWDGLGAIEVLANGSLSAVLGSRASKAGMSHELENITRWAGRGGSPTAATRLTASRHTVSPVRAAVAATAASDGEGFSLVLMWSVITGAAERMGSMGFPYIPSLGGRVDGMMQSFQGEPVTTVDNKLVIVEDGFFASTSLLNWVVLLVLSVVLFAVDWFVIRRFVPPTFKWHLATVAFWLVVAGFYNVYVAIHDGHVGAVDWLTGYVLEWALSIDNLFVFHLVFSSFQTPSEQRHKAVFVGIVGAVVARLVFFMVVSTLLHLFSWIRWPFGILLIWSGIESVRSDDDEFDVKGTKTVRALKWCLGDRLYEGYTEDASIFRCADGHCQVTLLFLVIACLELTDIFFALDSVSAKIAQIPEPHLALSSTILAMFGLRGAFFVVQDLVEMFDLLKYGLCLILILIGVELMIMHLWNAPSWLVCCVLVGIFALCIALSVLKQYFLMNAGKEDLDSPEGLSNASARPAVGAGRSDTEGTSSSGQQAIIPDTGGHPAAEVLKRARSNRAEVSA